jgi:DNA-binding PadR family transcriptional regulator
MAQQEMERLERSLLLHLLEHRGQQIRFEADQWTTEFGIARKFSNEDPATLKNALRSLEMSRMVFRRTQYVVGYSEPKHVFSLTPSGHRKALEHLHEEGGELHGPANVSDEEPPSVAPRSHRREPATGE